MTVPGYLGQVVDAAGSPAGTCFQIQPGVLVTAWDVAPVDPGEDLHVVPAAGAPMLTATVHTADRWAGLTVLTSATPLPDVVAGLAPATHTAPGSAVTVPTVDGDQAGVWQGLAIVEGAPAGTFTTAGHGPPSLGAPVLRNADATVLGAVVGGGRVATLQSAMRLLAGSIEVRDLLADPATLEGALSGLDGAELALLARISVHREPVEPPAGSAMALRRLVERRLVGVVLEERLVVHHRIAAALARRWAGTPRLAEAHRGAAGYWRNHADPVQALDEERYHLAAAGDADAAEEVTERLCGRLFERGAWTRESVLLHELLERHPHDSPRSAHIRRELAGIARGRGELAEAERLDRAAFAIAREHEDVAGMAAGYVQLAGYAQDRGELVDAERLARRALEIAEPTADPGNVARIRMRLAAVLADQGNGTRAEAIFRDALESFAALGDRGGEAAALQALAGLAGRRGELALAERLSGHALAIHVEGGNMRSAAEVLVQLGQIVYLRGDRDQAVQLLGRALSMYQEMGDRTGAQAALSGLERLRSDRS